MKHHWSGNGRFLVLFIMLGLVFFSYPIVTPQTSQVAHAAPCTGTNTDITGNVFRDYNVDGVDAGAIEPAIADITVTAYDADNNVVTSCETDANGNYDLTIGAANFPVRLELSNIPDYLRPGPAGPGSATTVTFVSGATSGLNFGLANPAQYCEAATDQLVTTCFVNGSATNFGVSPNDTLVRWAYTLRGDTTMPTHIADRSTIGSAWGLAYNPETQDLYTAAFLKRHVGLQNGLGSIFLVDPYGAFPNGSLFVDVTTLGVDVGEIGADAARGLVADPATQSNDPTAYYAVGKLGIGDLTLDEDYQALWFINLYNQTLYSLEVDSDSNASTPPTATDLNAFPIPTAQCNSYTTLYLNAGGTDFATLVDPGWNGDGYYVGGAISNTAGSPSAPYGSKRTGSSFDYLVPLRDGTYDVTLHAFSNSAATFDATIEGNTQPVSFAANSAFTDVRNVTVTDGMMNMTFNNASIGTPTISGIQIAATGGQEFNETAAFALKEHDGALYVGLVCTAEYSQNANNLSAYVYRLNGGSFTQVDTFPLNYTKGYATDSGNCELPLYSNWHPWVTAFPANCASTNLRTVWPQPILSGIEFDIDDSMILTFMDRLGHQLGNKNYVLSGTEQREVVIGGDILRVYNNNGTYQLESNGSAGPLTASWLTPDNGVGNGDGPSGGEFYQDDVTPPRTHREISVGGIAHIEGTGEVVGTVMDPIGDAESGGVMFFDNLTGGSTTDPLVEESFDGYEVYESTGTATFGKANGLGDLVLLCTAAPLALGNRVWIDDNLNGVQDADELGRNNVTVGLYDASGTLLASMVTINDAQGNAGFYQFINDDMDTATWVTPGDAVQPNTDYIIAIFDSEFTAGGDLVNYSMTANNQDPFASLPTPEIRDSDGVGVAVGTGTNTAVRGVTLTTGGPGENDHTYDFGFVIAATDWGDAPDSPYPTLLGAGSSAYHFLVNGGPYMGSCVDSETNGQPDATATGDDSALGGTGFGICTGNDDEDGIGGNFLTTPLMLGDPVSPISINVASTGISCVVNAWVDFNNDGDWDEPNEQIFTDEALASGNHNLTFAVPDTAVSDVTTSARFRCSTVTGLNATDVAPDGEVEDYQVDIAAAFDYGDLPDAPYGTLAPGGAHHLLNGIWLGATVDAEGTGFPSTGANGDDANSGDDEDGILFDAGTWGDGTGEVEATVSGGSGCLIGWVDFEGLNGFGDNVNDSLGLVSEHIFTAFLTPGTTTVSFDTPASTTGGGDYVYPATLNMRFRFFPANDPLFASESLALDGNGCPAASNSTLAMDAISVGAANNGEVEDYVQSFSPTAITLQSFGITSPFAMWSLITIILASLALITIILLQGRAIERQRKAITRRPSR